MEGYVYKLLEMIMNNKCNKSEQKLTSRSHKIHDYSISSCSTANSPLKNEPQNIKKSIANSGEVPYFLSIHSKSKADDAKFNLFEDTSKT